jgi:hypothetical protein
VVPAATPVSPPPPGSGQTPPPPPPPAITSVRETNSIWRLGSSLAHLSARRPPVGTVFSFALASAAAVRFEFFTRAPGRRAKGGCVAPTHSNRRGRSCRRSVSSGTLALAGHPGTNRVSFQGRLSPTRKLAPGRYTLLIAASNAGGRAYGGPLSFTIVK